MVIILVILAGGMTLGFIIRKKEKTLRCFSLASSAAVYLLLFLLGVSVGGNKLIIENFGSLGTKAIFIAFASIAGSVFLSWAAYILFFRKRK